jgi:NDP-sugar pyrophosphorylase family protein
VLAGGLGTRLRPRVDDRPKALAPTGNIPFIARQLEWLHRQGVRFVVLAIHHMAEQIETYAARDYAGPLRLSCVRDPREPLGTGGAIKNAFGGANLTDDCLVLNGDTLFSFELAPFVRQHQRQGTGATMVIASVPDVARFGSVRVAQDRITDFLQASGEHVPGQVNCGAYLLAPAVVARMPNGSFSLERDYLPSLAAEQKLAAHVLPADQGFIDIGTPESYDAFCRDIVRA